MTGKLTKFLETRTKWKIELNVFNIVFGLFALLKNCFPHNLFSYVKSIQNQISHGIN